MLYIFGSLNTDDHLSLRFFVCVLLQEKSKIISKACALWGCSQKGLKLSIVKSTSI